MKIIMRDCVYVQKNDLIYLWNHEHEILSSVVLKVFGNGVVIVNDSNRYEFVKFEDPSEIEYFKNLDWIVDYNSVKDLNKTGFVVLGEEITMEMKKIANKFDAMSEEERVNNFDMVDDYQKLEFKMYSLRDILWFKEGKIRMTLPNGVAYPRGIVTEERKETGLRRILNRFKKY